MGRLRKMLFGISLDEASFARRGFQSSVPEVQAHLERVGRTFLHGYHAALLDARPLALAERLATVERAWQGFAFEGAAMGLALLDRLLPGRRLRAFLDGPGAAHVYMVHVGAGWAYARLGGLTRSMAWLDPLLRWLAVDGYGFHQGYFHGPRFVRNQALPRRLSGYALRVFDQGLGRSLWFVEGADVDRIAATIAAFPEPRRADLWSGVGLACAYAGGVGQADLERLRAQAEGFEAELAQGAAFAAQARRRAGNPAEHTAMACKVVCGVSADGAAAVTERALHDLPPDGALPAYEVWRQRIQAHFTEREDDARALVAPAPARS
jgi:hypothetical protein